MNTRSMSSQQGAALAIALVMLVVITLIALTASKLTGMEMKMSLNSSQLAEAEQNSESVMDAVVTGPAQSLAITTDGFKTCSTNWPAATASADGCNDLLLDLSTVTGVDVSKTRASVEYLGTVNNFDIPPRLSENFASSVTARAALMDVTIQYAPSGGDVELGEASTGVSEGLIRLYAIPK